MEAGVHAKVRGGWSQQHYLQKPLSGDSLNAHRQVNGETKCGLSIRWNTSQ